MPDSAHARSGADDPPPESSASGGAALGEFIRSQRRLAELSQRELARLADLSDAYLSQLERGLHEPSIRVLNGLARALNVPNDRLVWFLGRAEGDDEVTSEQVIAADERLTAAQRQSLLELLAAFLAANDAVDDGGTDGDQR
ncbi:MAG: helix-turn-helix transcriptional regulator [Actinomycetota bacterium]